MKYHLSDNFSSEPLWFDSLKEAEDYINSADKNIVYTLYDCTNSVVFSNDPIFSTFPKL